MALKKVRAPDCQDHDQSRSCNGRHHRPGPAKRGRRIWSPSRRGTIPPRASSSSSSRARPTRSPSRSTCCSRSTVNPRSRHKMGACTRLHRFLSSTMPKPQKFPKRTWS